MGAQIQGVPEAHAVAAGADSFGAWFCRQRELRGISVWFVAARTKLAAERIQRLERGELPLPPDGHGRATARALARAIGADPEEAASLLSRPAARPRPRRRPAWLAPAVRVGRSLALVGVLGGTVWLLGLWLEDLQASGDSPRTVLRPDYVERLLGGDDY